MRIAGVKRNRKLTIFVNGKPVEAYEGETVLAAMLAAGYKKIKTSPVLKQPRCGFCGMGVCYECTVTVDGIPNQRACMTEVADNMEIETDE